MSAASQSESRVDSTGQIMYDALAEQVLAHIERHLEPVRQVLRDPSADAQRIDVAHVAASETRPVHTLITVGMSASTMPVPKSGDMPERIELMMVLPRQWKLDEASLREEAWSWPVTHLRRLARRASSQWLGWGSVAPNGDPPEPLVSGTRLCGFVIVPSLHVPPSFYQLESRVGDVTFYAAVPLYAEEMQLARDKGARALFESLIDHDVRDLIDMKRRNVAKKRFGFF
jgi:hypothetical protein